MTIEKIKKFIATCEKINKGEVKYCSYEFIERAEQIARELEKEKKKKEKRKYDYAATEIPEESINKELREYWFNSNKED